MKDSRGVSSQNVRVACSPNEGHLYWAMKATKIIKASNQDLRTMERTIDVWPK